MTYDEVIRRFGTQVRLASVLGITQPTVSAWKGIIPKQYQFQIEVLTHGELRVDPELIPDRIDQDRRQRVAHRERRGQMR
jgi:hypothetical protein